MAFAGQFCSELQDEPADTDTEDVARLPLQSRARIRLSYL